MALIRSQNVHFYQYGGVFGYTGVSQQIHPDVLPTVVNGISQ